MSNYRLCARVLAAECMANAIKRIRPRIVAKPTITQFNGYLIERLYPSGMFRVFHERVGHQVLQPTLKKAREIARENCIME